MVLRHPVFGQAVVRDQKPMDNRGLERCLQDELTPVEWYQMLNARVFFWLTRERLLRLLRAGAYADKEHDVLELDAAPLVRLTARQSLCLQSTVVALSRFRAHAGAQPSSPLTTIHMPRGERRENEESVLSSFQSSVEFLTLVDT
jgi:hypothetical protein